MTSQGVKIQLPSGGQFSAAVDTWEGAHDEIVDFFDATVDLLKLAQGHRESMHWVKAQRFLQFPEPKEFALGLSMGHPEGSGIGPDLAREMCEGLEFCREQDEAPMIACPRGLPCSYRASA
jgi:hypothetical protein